MLDGLLRRFARPGDTDEEARGKQILVPTMLIALASALGRVVGLPQTYADNEGLALMEAGAAMLVAVQAIYHLVRIHFSGLTTAVKVRVMETAVLSISLDALIFGANHEVHSIYSVILMLGACITTEKDQQEMRRARSKVFWAGFLYIVLKSCATALGTTIHPFQVDYRGDVGFVTGMLPLLVTFFRMTSFGDSSRTEAQSLRDSVKVATAVARRLADFDLDSAEELLVQHGSSDPTVEPLHSVLQNLRSYRPFLPSSLLVRGVGAEYALVPRDSPNMTLAEAMYGRETSWSHVDSAVSRLRDPDYSLEEFDEDMRLAFPELMLYEAADSSESPASDGTGTTSMTSGRSGYEEFQRTMGALYSVYCFARLDIDGKDLFSYGVGVSSLCDKGLEVSEKRTRFLNEMKWDKVEELMLRARLIQTDHWRGFMVNERRMRAFLVLTAMHDVMKNAALLPTVKKEHAPFHGFDAGEVISDHDLALAYVMEHFPNLLPSFRGLDPGQRAPIMFCQGKMGFNNGWMVQGEAPPGALLSSFKRIIQAGRAPEADIAFYFAHWITDLAGAEPFGERPWPGSEKLVLKFPSRVLVAFLESFSFVDRLAVRSEVEVLEDYLESCWEALGLQSVPVALGIRVAAMRVALMAQGFEQQAVLELIKLQGKPLLTMAVEMSRTGLRQHFRCTPEAAYPGGPALLVYYAPAMLQKAGAEHVRPALLVLAEVYRAARVLFPLSEANIESTVVVRIDALKDLTPEGIAAAPAWHLAKTSSSEAVAVKGPMPTNDSIRSGRATAAALHLSCESIDLCTRVA